MSGTMLILGAVLLGGAVSPTVTQDASAFADSSRAALPAEVVAARVRSILHDHTDPSAWKGLARSLPDMAARSGTDSEGTLEAAHLVAEMLDDVSPEGTVPRRSDSTAHAAQTVEDRSGRARPPEREAWIGWASVPLPSYRLTDLQTRLGIWIAAGLLAVLVTPRVMRRSATRSALARPVRVRLNSARSLAERGTSITDIARKTGLAREALTIMLQPNGR